MTVVDKIKTIDVSLYPKMWCDLNSYKYPEELSEFRPKNWDILSQDAQSIHIAEPFNYLTNAVSEKELLRYWNRDRHPGAEWDVWWESRKSVSEKEHQFLRNLYNETVNYINN